MMESNHLGMQNKLKTHQTKKFSLFHAALDCMLISNGNITLCLCKINCVDPPNSFCSCQTKYCKECFKQMINPYHSLWLNL